MFSEFPYSEWHQLNLDWILESIKYLMEHGGGGGAVISVNGKTGVVQLFPYDVGAIPMPENATTGQVLTFDGADWTADNIPDDVAIFEMNVSTVAEIEAAYQAGKRCYCKSGTGHIYLPLDSRPSSTHFKFCRANSLKGVTTIDVDNSTWTVTSDYFIKRNNIPIPQNGDVLTYNNGEWIASALPLYNGG